MQSNLQNISGQISIVNVYMRNVKKEARLVQLYSPATSADIIVIASAKFSIPQSRIILYYNGFRIDNYSKPINLTQKSIIHIIDRRNLQSHKINVTFKPIGWNVPTFKLSLPPDTIIKEIIRSYLVQQYKIQQNRFFIVYAGRTLNTSNTLKQQFIEDDSELIVIQHRPIKDTFQREAIQFTSQRHLQDRDISSLKYNCPVTHFTSIEALKKKSQQQALMAQQQIQNTNLNAAPPKIVPNQHSSPNNDSFLNNTAPFNINISAIHPPNAQILDESVAPLDKNIQKGSKQSSQQRSAPFSDEKSGQPKIKINKSATEVAPQQKLNPSKEMKSILQLQSNQHMINSNSNSAIPFSKDSGEIKNEKDSFFDSKSANA